MLGWAYERIVKAAGIRTHILVGMGCYLLAAASSVRAFCVLRIEVDIGGVIKPPDNNED